MPIIDEKGWEETIKNNSDQYGAAAVSVATKVIEVLDEIAEDGAVNADQLITDADRALNMGITGFQAGCIASIISQVHSRGAEFRASWNNSIQLQDEGDVATAKGTTLNPALLKISTKKS